MQDSGARRIPTALGPLLEEQGEDGGEHRDQVWV